MKRTYAREKVHLGLVLELVAAGMSPRSGEFVDRLAHHLNCSTRAVKDALAVLRRAGYIDVEIDAEDRRRRHFRVTERGARLSSSAYGWVVLRLARRLLTTCPSPRVAASHRALSEQERDERLARAEAALLGWEEA